MAILLNKHIYFLIAGSLIGISMDIAHNFIILGVFINIFILSIRMIAVINTPEVYPRILKSSQREIESKFDFITDLYVIFLGFFFGYNYGIAILSIILAKSLFIYTFSNIKNYKIAK